MSKPKKDVYPSSGGSFEIRNGKAVKVGGGTEEHPDGNRARPASDTSTPEPTPSKDRPSAAVKFVDIDRD